MVDARLRALGAEIRKIIRRAPGEHRERLVSRLGTAFLRSQYPGRPVPLERIVRLGALAGGDNPMQPKHLRPQSSRKLENRALQHQLSGALLGHWALRAETLNFLERHIRATRPRLAIEFGSGVSTVCLATYMRELHDVAAPAVFSFEQSVEFAIATRDMLERAELGEIAHVAHAPIIEAEVNGRRLPCYSPAALEILEGLEADLLLIDGPTAPPGVDDQIRRATLPVARCWLRNGAWFFLDDALRDGELAIGMEWARAPGVAVHGVRLIGQGLLEGRVLSPEPG